MFLKDILLIYFRERLMLAKKMAFFRDHQLNILAVIIGGIIYWIFIPFKPYVGSFLIKWLPVGLLLLMAWPYRAKDATAFLLAALFFHGIGDIIIDFEGDIYILLAIFPFILGHVLYIFAFKEDARPWTQLNGWEKALIVLIFVHGLIMASILLSILKLVFLLLIAVYMIIILSMVAYSIRADYSERLVLVGAFLYLLSDTVIAISSFVQFLPWSPYFTWPTYLLGQLFITVGYLSEKIESLTASS